MPAGERFYLERETGIALRVACGETLRRLQVRVVGVGVRDRTGDPLLGKNAGLVCRAAEVPGLVRHVADGAQRVAQEVQRVVAAVDRGEGAALMQESVRLVVNERRQARLLRETRRPREFRGRRRVW